MQQMAQWQQQFPMQFMPPMMVGVQMQFPTGGQFHQFPMFPRMQYGGQQNSTPNQSKSQSQNRGQVLSSYSQDSFVVGQPKTVDSNMKKGTAFVSNGLMFDQKYKDVIFFNCGEPCHYVGMCSRQRKCFMCGSPGHHMDKFPEWYITIPMAHFYVSASSGLGFFHVEVDKPSASLWLNLDNVGVTVVDGEISMEELKQNFSEIWKTNWPW
jgi:hypothetical protein